MGRTRAATFMLYACVAMASPSLSEAQAGTTVPVAHSTVRRANLPRSFDSALQTGKLHIVDRGLVATPAANSSRIAFGGGRFLATRVGEKATIDAHPEIPGKTGPAGIRAIDSVILLPFRYLGHTQDNSTVHLSPVVVRDEPMQYDSNGVFRGSILIGLEDSMAPTIHKELDGRIQFRLVSGGFGPSPDSLELASTNLPLTRVRLAGREASDSVSVRVIPQFDLRGTVIWLPVHPALVFEDPPRTASGLGIETVTFPVRIVGTSIRDHVTVTLATDRGSLKESRVDVDPAGSATVHLRSSGIGPARITATSPGIASSTVTVDFVWPIVFLGAALLGGIVGGLAKKFVIGDAAGGPGTGRAIAIGLLTGFVVAVAYYAVDVNLLQFKSLPPFFDEAAVFAVALLGAMFGVRAPKPAG